MFTIEVSNSLAGCNVFTTTTFLKSEVNRWSKEFTLALPKNSIDHVRLQRPTGPAEPREEKRHWSWAAKWLKTPRVVARYGTVGGDGCRVRLNDFLSSWYSSSQCQGMPACNTER